ncbi:ABC transporter permease subunit [Mordavella massiliensis]|uniref:carbohydrate ABC transporter permease n=1 Tax=Mordavella massiliensis TaxID=1871024 RepID=UPI00210F1F6C|nr:sugar ABC transporter permease [Mordavella massiliensis]
MNYVKIGNIKINRGVLFILPGILFFTIMVIYPAGYVIYLSLFTEGKGLGLEPAFVGLKNYITVFTSNSFWQIMSNTLFYSFVATACHIVIGMAMAVLLNNKLLKRKTLTAGRSLFLVPWAISPSVVAIMFQVMLHPKVGPIGIILRQFDPSIEFNPLGDPTLSLLTVTLTNIWKFTPFYFLVLLAGLQAIDDGLYEAARMDGATGWKQFTKVTLPLMKNYIITLAVFDFVSTMAYMDLTWIMTKGGPLNSSEVLSTLAYRTSFQNFRFGEGSAVGVLIFLISIIFTTIAMRLMSEED